VVETVREERSLGGRSAFGEVALAGDARSAEVSRLAAGRAWFALAAVLADGGRVDDAYTAASAGLDEIGDSYAAPRTEDDTTLKLLRAEDLYDSDPARGAVAMQRVLENRLALLAERLAGVVLD